MAVNPDARAPSTISNLMNNCLAITIININSSYRCASLSKYRTLCLPTLASQDPTPSTSRQELRQVLSPCIQTVSSSTNLCRWGRCRVGLPITRYEEYHQILRQLQRWYLALVVIQMCIRCNQAHAPAPNALSTHQQEHSNKQQRCKITRWFLRPRWTWWQRSNISNKPTNRQQ